MLFYKSGHLFIKNKAGTVITRYNKRLNSAELVINLDVVMIKHSGWNFPRSDSSPILLLGDCAVIKVN